MPVKQVTQTTYRKLLSDIAAVYESARTAIVRAYWEVGRRIVEVEQAGNDKAAYGVKLLERLSCDLTKKHGAGFSLTNLKRMRQFYLINQKSPSMDQLSWTQNIALLGVKNEQVRTKLIRRITQEKLPAKRICTLVKEYRSAENNGRKGADEHEPPPQLKPVTPGKLHTYTRVPAAEIYDATCKTKTTETIDLGFNIWETIPKKQLSTSRFKLATVSSYTYAATVEKVIDGDTVWVEIDCGFDTLVREKLRLRGIDAPELGTPEGEKAKRFVKRALPPGTQILIVTSKSDKYDRYLADVWYKRDKGQGARDKGCSVRSPSGLDALCAHIHTNGVYLNQELLNNGLAAVWG